MSEEYISKERFFEDIKYIEKELTEFGHELTKEDVLKYLAEHAFSIKITRCKDCAYRNTEHCAMSFDNYEWTTDRSFCSFSKRKENQNE